MADTTTLTPTLTSQPKEKGRKPPIFGGFNDLIGETFELVARGQGDFVKEGPVERTDLEQIRQMPEHKVEPAAFSPEGSMTGFQNARTLVDTSPEARISSLEAEQFKVWRQHLAKATVEEKRVNINELDGLQVLYRGSVDDEGNVTEYHQSEADKKQSENIALSIQKKRAEKLAATQTGTKRVSSKGAVSGADELQTRIYGADIKRTFEDHNMQGPG